MQQELPNPIGNYRHQIQMLISKYNKKKRKLFYQCRKNGHNTLSESIRLLTLIDADRALHSSYDNIHTNECVYGFFDKKRNNFRDFVTKQFGHNVAQYCADNNINVAFIEDIEIQTDRDNDNNSLARLFAAGQLKKAIENALHNFGIGYVDVNPMGTSRTDPVTGDFAHRDKFDKTKLFVMRDGKIGRTHADLAASINVLLQGLSHSVFPYKFWVRNGVIKSKARINQFLSVRPFNGFKDYIGEIYTTPRGFVTKKEKKMIVDQIKALALSTKEIEEFAINGPNIKTYMAFKVAKALDCV